MLSIKRYNDQILLIYTAELASAKWVDDKLKTTGSVTFQRIFTFDYERLINNDDLDFLLDDDRAFILSNLEGDFFKVDKDILGIKHDLFLSKEMKIDINTFVAYRNISIFRKIDDLVDESIVIGGGGENSIPIEEFNELLRNFPTSTELNHYARSRIYRVIKDYLKTTSDAQKKLENYLRKRKTIHTKHTFDFIKRYELEKFEFVRDKLQEMLNDAETYSEKEWQNIIVDFLRLIFPKYIAVLENLHIKDFYSNPTKPTNRFIDLMLVDASGAVDVVEIKKPFNNCILSSGKYRDNYTPKLDLSGSVVQVEKYLFHLSKWGRDGEVKILEKNRNELPSGFKISITNPKGFIILGRDRDFKNGQRFDFEIIRRSYSNIIDIITYDDLLRRINNIIEMIRRD